MLGLGSAFEEKKTPPKLDLMKGAISPDQDDDEAEDHDDEDGESSFGDDEDADAVDLALDL